jgi:hypothetical protein
MGSLMTINGCLIANGLLEEEKGHGLVMVSENLLEERHGIRVATSLLN